MMCPLQGILSVARSLPSSLPRTVLRFPALLDLEAVFAVLNDYTSLALHCTADDVASPECGPVVGRTDRPTDRPTASLVAPRSQSELSVRPNALLLLLLLGPSV